MKIVLERPKVRETAISMLVDGISHAQVADSVSHRGQTVTPQAVSLFALKHAAEIDARKSALAVVVADEWLSSKEERIRRLADVYARVEDALLEHGVMVTETRTYGTSDKPEVVATQRFNGSMIRELRGILRDAAEELGQIPRASDTNITNNLQVLIRQYNADTEGI